MKYFLRFFIHLFTFLFLTVLTQIGGLVYLLSLLVNKFWKKELRLTKVIVFLLLYMLSTFIIVPVVAPFFGRERIQNTDLILPTNKMTVFLNRNYVRPELNRLLHQVEHELKGTGIQVHYLDANFPFINKFPLLPHLSHNDGKKIDVSLIYQDKKAVISTKQKSRSGYGVFENPNKNEHNQAKTCKSKGNQYYDFPKYLTLGEINEELKFSKNGTRQLIHAFLKQRELGKIFIEPHLKQRMGIKSSKVRYQGCHSVRHDDHIHVQLR